MDIDLMGKRLEVRLTPSAQRALEQRKSPLQVELELLFSCLIRKRVRFGERTSGEATAVTDRLWVRFRPVMTQACALTDALGGPELDDFPIANPHPYVPRWLAIDYRRDQWLGEMGY
jgi:hypothetical protein